jgi:hypothetical protein
VRNILPPSPFRSAWTFLAYCLTLSTPAWTLLTILGNVDLIAAYTDHIGDVLTHPLGMWIPVAVGFVLLILINYRERSTTNAPPGASATLDTKNDAAQPTTQTGDTEIKRFKAENEQLKQQTNNQQVEYEEVFKELRAAKRERAEFKRQAEQLQTERDTLREEKRRDLKGQRCKRIEEWRSVIQNFDFDRGRFASTDTYAQMKPHLRPEVIEMLENYRMGYVGNEARGKWTYGYTLLDEAARIEREWGLI